MKSQQIQINFLNINVFLTTNNDIYSRFLKKYFAPLICKNNLDKHSISINILFDRNNWNKIVADEISEGSSKVGANTYISKGKVASVFKDKQKIFFSWQNKKSLIECKTVVRWLPTANKLFKFFQKSEKEEYFYQLTLQAIYYPLFYYLYKNKNMAVLHASAVQYQGQGILICGLDGVGKTCCALSLIKDNNAFLISDNLVFINQEKVHSCYEQIRLHKDQEHILDNNFQRIDGSNCLKGFYIPSQKKLTKESKIKKIIFIESAERNKIIPISLDQAVHRSICLSKLAGELEKYQLFFSLYDLLSDNHSVLEEKILRSAFIGADFYRVQLDFSLGIEYNINFIKRNLGLG